MTLAEIIALDKQYYMNTFGDRVPVCFTGGRGIRLKDTGGRTYLDFFAGIAVSVLGHAHPILVEAIRRQAEKLLHCSNYYYIETQALLAEKLAGLTCADRFFFGNSGAEANEAAIKLARLYYRKQGREDKHVVVSLKDSFHGRTITTLAATGQAKYAAPFAPLTPGFIHVTMNDDDAMAEALGDGSRICAVLVEPIQGESGVRPADPGWLTRLRGACDRLDILLIFDEVQCGMGRTGKFLACEHYGVEPDILTLAKALGGGVPIGVTGAKEHVAAFAPGEHGSTFGGNPLACAAGLAVLSVLEKEGLVQKAALTGADFMDRLSGMQAACPVIREVRGRGLMLGVEYTDPIAGKVKEKMMEAGYLVGLSGEHVTRILPPLILEKADVDGFLPVYRRVLDEILS